MLASWARLTGQCPVCGVSLAVSLKPSLMAPVAIGLLYGCPINRLPSNLSRGRQVPLSIFYG